MKLIANLALRAAILGLAMQVFAVAKVTAGQVEDAEALVAKFYTAFIAEDGKTISGMFAPDSQNSYTIKVGYGVPDWVINFTGGKDWPYVFDYEIPEEFAEYMAGYAERDHGYKIRSAKSDGDKVKVQAQLTSKYTTDAYSGQNFQDDTFTIEPRDGKPVIVAYDGVGYSK